MSGGVMTSWDVIVIGAGHAGCEAAAAAGRYGASTLLLTHKLETIGEMSCNPAIGGLGKGHLVREIDALDGLMARVADQAGIQFRILNASRGPAVRGPRAQIDRARYRMAMSAALKLQDNLSVMAEAVEDLIVEDGRVAGVVCASGVAYRAPRVVLTTGTFLRGVIHRGDERVPAGRAGDAPAVGLADRLYSLGLGLGRLKTGTPPRLDGRTIDWSGLAMQAGDKTPTPFSFISGPNSDSTGSLRNHRDDGRHACGHRGPAERVSGVRGPGSGEGSSLLSVDRGQGRAVLGP